MPPHSPQKAGKLARQSAELAFAAPQVIAHRVSRMWMAGTAPSARDQHEFYTMGTEKIWAFYEAWQAMTYEMGRNNMYFMMKLMNPWECCKASGVFHPFIMQDMMLGVMNKGMTPVRKRAVANAKRLAKSKN